MIIREPCLLILFCILFRNALPFPISCCLISPLNGSEIVAFSGAVRSKKQNFEQLFLLSANE